MSLNGRRVNSPPDSGGQLPSISGGGLAIVSIALLILSFTVSAHATVVGGAAAGPDGARFIKLRLPLPNPVGRRTAWARIRSTCLISMPSMRIKTFS
jgi:hypothetical protein